MRTGVYKFTCVPTGRFYIGSAQDVRRRKQRHLSSLRHNNHHNVFFQRVFNKYGEENFVFQIMLTDTLEEARELEQHLLDKHLLKSKCMNIGAGATGGDNLSNHPDRAKIIKKIKKSLNTLIENFSDEERLARWSRPGSENGMYGKTHTESARKKISQANKGMSWTKGIPKSEEHCRKLSEHAKTRTAERNPFYGKKHTKALKKHLSKVAKERVAAGILPSNTLQVKVGKRKFRSAAFAAKEIGCAAATILNRVRSDKFPDYSFINA